MQDFQPKTVLVVGDLMIDRYIHGKVLRISPEAPVPVFHRTQERLVLGGAGNVIANLRAAGQEVMVVSAIGSDENGEQLLSMLHEQHVQADGILQSSMRTTTTKTRFIGQNGQQLFRMDEEDPSDIERDTCEGLLKRFDNMLIHADIVVVSDYGKGVLSTYFCQQVLRRAAGNGVKTIVDVKGSNAVKYTGAFLLKPNLDELHQLTGDGGNEEPELQAEAKKLCGMTQCEHVLITRSAQGMSLAGADGDWWTIPAYAREVFDVTGAGDTAIAYLAACLANGLSVKESTKIANIASGIKVSKRGTATVNLYELKHELKRIEAVSQMAQKQVASEDIAELRQLYSDRRIVFTNGCFDILHVGHVEYLRKAAELGDILIVGVNSDESVRRLKGNTRPINNLYDRIQILSALEFIDHVIAFEEDTPERLIRMVRPDVLVKGGDYTKEQIVGADYVEAYGGCVTTIPLTEGKSTTRLIDQMRKEK